MRTFRKLKSAAAGLIAGAMLATTFSAVPAQPTEADAASTCTINTNKLYQSIDGFGGINHPEWYGDLTDADRQLAFGNGEGQLAVQFEKLKAKLEKEGLFSAEHKKTLPDFPSKVAVVTSETGAAVRDIIRTIKNKNDYVDILVYPVLVQGPAAAGDIAAALRDLNENYSDVDVIITGRGGGSMEELWAFNEEVVARSIFDSVIPVISAVGHETDFTISDFTADFRAATPTAAAEMAVPDTRELREYLSGIKESLAESLMQAVEIRRNRLAALDPNAFAKGISTRIAYEQMNADRIIESMGESLASRISSGRERIELLKALLDASDPKSILSRGYSVVTDEDGHIISRAEELKIGQNVNIETGSGSAGAEITRVN